MFECSMAIKNDVVEEHLMTWKMFTEKFYLFNNQLSGPKLLEKYQMDL